MNWSDHFSSWQKRIWYQKFEKKEMKTKTINFTICLGASSKNSKDLHSSNSFWKLRLCCGILWHTDELSALFQFLHLSFNSIHRAVVTRTWWSLREPMALLPGVPRNCFLSYSSLHFWPDNFIMGIRMAE